MKINSKGFTLVEIIVAISIMGIVTSVGYNTLNTTNRSIVDQQVINNGQMDVNLVNKYLTKDLEQCRKLIGPTNIDELPEGVKSSYKFELNEGTNKIEYYVNIFEINGKDYYKLIRNSNGTSIEVISKQKTNILNPIKITKNSLSNIYDVEVEYMENQSEKSKVYDFSVASIVGDLIVAQKIPQIDTSKNRGTIGFQFYNPPTDLGNIKIVASGAEGGEEEEELTPVKQAAYIGTSNKHEFDITMTIDARNNNGKLDATMEDLGPKAESDRFIVDKAKFGKDFITDIIVLEISDNIELKELRLHGKKPTCLSSSCNYNEESDIYGSGEHIFTFEETKLLDITGKMIIKNPDDIGTHFINITSGKSK